MCAELFVEVGESARRLGPMTASKNRTVVSEELRRRRVLVEALFILVFPCFFP